MSLSSKYLKENETAWRVTQKWRILQYDLRRHHWKSTSAKKKHCPLLVCLHQVAKLALQGWISQLNYLRKPGGQHKKHIHGLYLGWKENEHWDKLFSLLLPLYPKLHGRTAASKHLRAFSCVYPGLRSSQAGGSWGNLVEKSVTIK